MWGQGFPRAGSHLSFRSSAMPDQVGIWGGCPRRLEVLASDEVDLDPDPDLAKSNWRICARKIRKVAALPSFACKWDGTQISCEYDMRERFGMARTFHNPCGRRRSTAMPAAIGTCHRRAVKPRGISEDDGALPVAEVKSDVVPAPASAWRQQRGKWGRLHGGRDSSAWRSLILIQPLRTF